MLEIEKDIKIHRVIDDGNGEPSNGELINNFEEVSSDSEEEDWSQRPEQRNEKLTEEHVVAAAVDFSHGQLPLVNRVLCLTDPNLHALDHVPFVQRSILHPLLAFKILYYKMIKFLGRRPFYSYFPTIQRDIQLVFLMFLYFFVSSSSMIYFFPMVAYYVTFCVMVITTFQMLQMKRDFLDFRVWSNLFITYSGGSLNTSETEYQFVRNNLKPFAHFFLALLINLIIYPIISDQWIPQSELTIIAFALTFMTLHSFMIKERGETFPDFLALLSFAVNVLAKYPYETDPVVTQGWRFLDLKIPTFASYIVGNGIEFCINFRVIFYMFIPILFVRIASRQNWRGTYKFLIPHCVTLSWLQIVIINSQGATMFGLVRGTLALVGAVMFLPLAGLTTIILPAIALTKWLATSISLYSFCVFLVFASIGLGISWLFARTRFNQHIALLQIILGVITFYFLVNSISVDNSIPNNYPDSNTVRSITWDQYQNLCHQPAWESDSIAVTQMRCSKLVNVQVEWEGYVNEIKISSITNTWKDIFDRLPTSLSQYFYCLYGDPIEADCENVQDIIEDDCLMLYDAIKSTQKCTLEKFNSYQFEISVRMHSGLWGKSAEIILTACHHFKNFSLQMKPNDKIKFRGLLTNSNLQGSNGILGGSKPQILLEEIYCTACHNSKLTETKLKVQRIFDLQKICSNFYLGIKFVLNVLFCPIVVFK